MSNMIERYLYDVTKRLPENIREDVKNELRSNIADMLSDDPSEEEIERVLMEMGPPAKLAVKYNPKPRYLISPELFDDYFTVLKIVAVTLGVLLAGLAIFKIIFGDIGDQSVIKTVVSIVTSFVSGAVTGIVYAFLFVTIAFACVERFSKNNEGHTWSPKQLPEIPANVKVVIKRGDTIAEAVFSIFFTTLFLAGTLRLPPFIAWYEAGAPTVPLFDRSVVVQFLPIYLILIALMLFLMFFKLVKGRWSVGIALAQSVFNIFNTVVGITFVTRPNVFTPEFIARFAEKVNITAETMTGYFDTGITVLIVLMILGTFGEIVSAITKTVKSYKVSCE